MIRLRTGNWARVRLHAVGVLAHDHTVLPHVGEQRLVTARVGHVEAGRDDADHTLPRRERTFVRGAVDARARARSRR